MKALSSLKITRLLETKSFAVALNGLLILSICAWSLHQWLSEGISAHSLIIMPVAPNSETTSNLDRVAERANQARLLSNWHLFGELSSKPQSQTKPQAAITPTAAPVLTPLIEDSDLDLALKGLLSYDDGEGFALIATAANEIHLFADQDEVLEGYTLDKVLTDHVLLRGQGRLLRLTLPKHLLDLRSKKQRQLQTKPASHRSRDPLPLPSNEYDVD